VQPGPVVGGPGLLPAGGRFVRRVLGVLQRVV
jgi:hypothetical protein